MADLTQELTEKVLSEFAKNIEANKRAKAILEKINAGEAVYKQAEEYAYQVGGALAKALRTAVDGSILPDRPIDEELAEALLRQGLIRDHELVAKAAADVQYALNRKAGLGLNAMTAELNRDRVDGLIRQLSKAERAEDAIRQIEEPVRNFSQGVVDSTLKRNVEFQGRAGLKPRIIRTAESNCCAWCSDLAGTYDYPNVPKDVYRRHRYCRCSVDYDPGSGSLRQNVWTKGWTDPEESAKIAARMQIGMNESIASSNNPAIINLQDIQIGRSVGAKAKNADVLDLATGERYQFAEGSRIQNAQVFAGKGTRTPYEMASKYANGYGGKVEDWQHAKGFAVLSTPDGDWGAEVHWSQCAGIGRVEFFIKRWLDE